MCLLVVSANVPCGSGRLFHCFFLQDLCFIVLFLVVSKVHVYHAGLLTAIHKECLRVMDYRELLFNDCGDRVAQLLHVQSVAPSQNQKGSVPQEFLIVNTHLLFPHDSSLCVVRLNQVCEAHVNPFSYSLMIV